jgi:outer membrane protein, heavy metal efflux system
MKSSTTRIMRVPALLMGLWLVAAHAEESVAPHESLTLAQAVDLATRHGPGIAALAAESAALSSRSEAGALPTNYAIAADFENFAGTGAASGTRQLEATLELSRTIELANKPALRRELGTAQLTQLAAVHHTRRAELAAEVARRFVHVLSDQALLNSARRSAELARAARDATQHRVSAGAMSSAALSRAEIALARAQIAAEHAAHELTSSRVRLSVLWGDTTGSFREASGDLFNLAAIESLEAYRQRLGNAPDLAKFAADAQVEDARVRLAEAQRSPDVTVSAGIRRLELLGDEALVASVSVPLGTRRRAELERTAARADRDRVDHERDTRRLELYASLFDLYQEIVHARTEASALHERVRPQAESMLATTSEGYRAGRFSLLELADAQMQLIEVEREAIRAAAQFHTLLVEIQRITGEPIHTLASGRAL